MSIEQINMIMAKLNVMHQSLVKLADRKTELIKTGDMEGIKKMINDEQAHISAIAQLEGQRQQAVSAYFKEHNMENTKQQTIERIIEIIPNEQEKQQLQATGNQLLQTIKYLQERNDLNQQLLFNSLQVVNLSLDLLRPQEENYNYGEKQGPRKTAQMASFDSKA